MAHTTGLQSLRARSCAPDQGRFLTRDTWQGTYTRPASLHRYTYAENNPVLYTDPSGQCLWCGVAVIGIAAAIALLIAAPHMNDIAPAVGRAVVDVVDACGDLVDELFKTVDRPIVVYRPQPQNKPTGTLVAPLYYPTSKPVTSTPSPTNTPTPTSTPQKHILYHYTDASGLAGIRGSQMIKPSLADDNRAAFGHGQYFTDISPVEAAIGSSYQMSRALNNSPWLNDKVIFYVGINVTGLDVEKVAPVFSKTYGSKYIYLHRSENNLLIEGRIESSGPVLYSK